MGFNVIKKLQDIGILMQIFRNQFVTISLSFCQRYVRGRYQTNSESEVPLPLGALNTIYRISTHVSKQSSSLFFYKN